MLFIIPQKLVSLQRYLNFCPDFFANAWKQFDKKANLNFKIYDVINWEANNYNTQIFQYLRT